MAKETRLEDTASIYQKRDEDETVKKVWSELDRSEKWQFFKDYFLVKIIIGIIAVTIIGRVLFVMLGPKPDTLLSTAIVYDNVDEEQLKIMHEDLNKYFDIKKNQELIFDTGYIKTTEDFAYNGSEKLSTMLLAGELDTIISDYNEFKNIGQYGHLKNLDVLLPDDIREALKDKFVYIDVVDNDDNNKVVGNYPLGIDLSDCEKYQALKPIIDKPILSVTMISKQDEYSIGLIRYLFDL